MIPKAVQQRANVQQNAEDMRAFYLSLGISPDITEKAVKLRQYDPIPARKAGGARTKRRPLRTALREGGPT